MDTKRDNRNIVQQRIESGMRVKEFCKAQGIRPSLYYYWRKKQQKEKGNKFHHISLPSNGSGSGVRILYPNGVQLEMYGEVRAEQVKSLIDVRI